MKHSGLRGVSFSPKRSCGSDRARGRAPLHQAPSEQTTCYRAAGRPRPAWPAPVGLVGSAANPVAAVEALARCQE